MADNPVISLTTYDKYANNKIKKTSFGGDSLKDVKKLDTAAETNPNAIPITMLKNEMYIKFHIVSPISFPVIGRDSSLSPSDLVIISATAW